MSNYEASLTLAAENYCVYLSGVADVVRPPEDDAALTAAHASEKMYNGLRSMAAAAAISCFGKTMNSLTRADGRFVDERMAAFAIEATDTAFDRYSDRIKNIGALTLEQECLRPCPIKEPKGMYLVRRARTDKITLDRLSLGYANDAYAQHLGRTYSDLRTLISDKKN